ncbi:PREDICTED: protein canopy 4 [Nicrophorus vespilloides]|uniref:Protein canopy 4 n=1 Tax=Nicrophorus vespilloides TaxID=110193 RepID=A0ABM1NFF1_NICVS|nr:PREDICTED: protein canopy 4 [Nicrophorus vespilloides]
MINCHCVSECEDWSFVVVPAGKQEKMLLKFLHALFLVGFLIASCRCVTEEDEGVKYANECEVCKILATELQERLEETGRTHEVLETGYAVDDIKPKKKTEYQKSELRLVESLEGVCDRILQYNIHKEREDSTRFAKGMSQTFQTLHGLVDKGVKVELGIPFELWDKPSVEITNMKTQCETLLEQNEGDIEDWYFKYQGKQSLKQYLCADRALKGKDTRCLNEKLKGETGKRKPDEL